MARPTFQQHMRFTRQTGASKVQLVPKRKPPTIAEIDTWKAEQARKGYPVGDYQAMLRDDGRVAQITWHRDLDHNRFMMWMTDRR